jgi:hypothetical protein
MSQDITNKGMVPAGTAAYAAVPAGTHVIHEVSFADLVVIARGPEPDPIPNSTVKSLRANGTKSQDLGE